MTAPGPELDVALRGIIDAILPLEPELRRMSLVEVLMQEFCLFPPVERRERLQALIDELPAWLSDTEEAMRRSIVENARRGL